MTGGPARSSRCAIYTRKSSDEGLEQDFNSLHAQRDACTAYILSQASEGWSALPDRYDDGGVSGGTLERPALKRLLADVAAGKIDVIVVYKVDRLSRSLFDFAKLVELFETAGTSFVSITQSFNTTSSMGRLTLNMLLSFAQFEREVTAERIRDKIAASKAKGMWMGGTPPIGYGPDGRSLAVVEQDAALVRDIFQHYLALGNVRLLTEQLERENVLTPSRVTLSGKTFGGVPFSRGQIYKLLSCPTYVGEVVHQGQTYQGLHQPIIERDQWDQVQQLLKANTQGGRRKRSYQRGSCLLGGKVTDHAGEPLLAVHASKGAVRYGYYISRSLQQAQGRGGMRIPARELDKAVVERLASALDDPLQLCATTNLTFHADEIASVDQRGRSAAAVIRGGDVELCQRLIDAVRVEDRRLLIHVGREAFATLLGFQAGKGASPITLTVEARLTRSGRAMRLVQGGAALSAAPEGSLIRLMGKAQLYWRELRQGQIDITRLAERERISPAYVTRVLRLAFLSPKVTEAILEGKQQAGISAVTLLQTRAIHSLWREQQRALLPGARANPGLA